jgi:pSer/pThr/pTyr-binding forkhead associated (FHA) protein
MNDLIEHVFLKIIYDNKVIRNLQLLRGHCVTVGRSTADIVFQHDLEMSNSHFRFEVGDYECRVTDLNSTNSTWLNKAKVSSATVKDGDELQAGRTIFKVQIQTAVSTPLAPPTNQQTVNDASITETSTDAKQVPENMPAATPSVEVEGKELDSWAMLLKEEPTDEVPIVGRPTDLQMKQPSVPPTLEQPTFSTVSERQIDLRTPVQVVLSVVGSEDKNCVCNAHDSTQIVIGREPSSDLQIVDEKVSSRHCLVEFVNQSFIVRDLDSTNGTTLNGQDILEAALSDGDTLQVGDTSLLVNLKFDSKMVGE